MGNLLVVENGRLRFQKTTSEVIIHDQYISSEKQHEIFNKFMAHWSRSGFSFSLKKLGTREKANEIIQERFAQDRDFFNNQKTPNYKLTIYQENYFYIDLERIDSGSAYQLTWQSEFKDTPSTYVSIDTSRGTFQADILHEVGHALGLAHEHQRTDRNLYVEPINSSQYQQALEEKQQVDIDGESVPFGPYDQYSIMHYPATFKLKANGDYIGGTLNAPAFSTTLSLGDLHTARFLYNESRIFECLKIMNSPLAMQHNNDKVNEEGITEEDNQYKRQSILLSRSHSETSVIERTFKVVKNQCEQLHRLSLPIEEQDNMLYQWAENNKNEENLEKQKLQQGIYLQANRYTMLHINNQQKYKADNQNKNAEEDKCILY